MGSIRLYLAMILAAVTLACAGGDNAEGDASRARASRAPAADTAASAARCAQHGAPAALCFICDASLRAEGRLWCAEHARYEDRCWICHPDLRDAARPYCEAHGLYEDECFLCRPELREAGVGAEMGSGDDMGTAVVESRLQCGEHRVPEAECGICHPDLTATLAPGAGLKIRFVSAQSAAKAGVTTALATRAPSRTEIAAVGEFRYNGNRMVRVTPLVEGIVRRVHTDLGRHVAAGAVLAEIASPRIAEAKATFLEAMAEETVAEQALARERELHERELTSEREFLEAQSRHAAARAVRISAQQSLIDVGFAPAEVEQIASGASAGSTLRLRAPFAGTVIERNAVDGNVVQSGDALFVIADLDLLWLVLSVHEGDAARVRPGQHVEVRSNALGRTTSGVVTWVASRLDEATRMVQVRVEVPDPRREWKAGMFVDARISVDTGALGFLVDDDAIHRFDGNPFVFIRVSDDLYEVRRVALAGVAGRRAVIGAGLDGSEQVVTARSFLVKSEFQKSRLGAGCVD